MTSDKDFLKRALIHEQETVRDYERFSDLTDNQELRDTFKQFAETEGEHSRKIKELLDKL